MRANYRHVTTYCACNHQVVAPTGFANTQERYSYRIPTISGLPALSLPIRSAYIWYVHRSGRVCLPSYSYLSIPQASVGSLTLILRRSIRSQPARPDGLPVSELDHEITRAISRVLKGLLMCGRSRYARTMEWTPLCRCPGGHRESAEVPGGSAGARVVCEQHQCNMRACASQMVNRLLVDCVR